MRMALGSVRVNARLLSWTLVLCGCGQSAVAPTVVKKVCEPATIYSCFSNNCNGHQSCNNDGSSMSKCVCDDDTNSAGSNASSDASTNTQDASARDASTPADDASAVDAQAPALHEICDNGKDDDGDGDIDCADSDCDSVMCVDDAPKGWQGPIAVQVGSAAPSDCRDMFSAKAFAAGSDPSADPATCSACSCSGDMPCAAFVDFGTGTTAACGGTTCTTSVNQSCAEIMPACIAGQTSAYLQTQLPMGGSCTPSTQAPTKPSADWKTHALGCAPAAAERGGCKNGSLCLPKKPGDPFADQYCIWREGEVDCPNAQFADKHVYYEELSDTRACSACSCSGPNCSYKWSVFDDSDTSCATPVLELASAGQCVQVNPASDKLRVGAAISGDGKCTPSGGVSQGEVKASKPVTVCCAQ
jgi:hypothetical protein